MSSTHAASALMRLTPRDRALLAVLHELRYLTAAQIQQVCYPTISVRSASHRLTVLHRRGVLECLAHRTFEDRRAFWGLTPLGRLAAATLDGAPAEATRAAAVTALQMDHLIATNQVFCDLCREQRAGRLGPFRWLGSHHTHVDLGQTRLIPDAMILVAAPAGDWWMYWLELDRGTMAAEPLADKLERYRLMRHLAAARADDPVWEARGASWLLFACANRTRAAEVARLAAACGLRRMWAGTAAECAASLAAAVGPGPRSMPAAPPDGRPAGLCPPGLDELSAVRLVSRSHAAAGRPRPAAPACEPAHDREPEQEVSR